ncbi:aquaporin Z [Pseudacidobacterium ailaaui]|uniref:aquaporin Z n=1 Tax=Pseudacidobacterium ailaaui TaxID=1382359 RepID=UPI0005D1FFE7|nr:aquaporin Z [Pseudacidobacterium ailaaui]
MSSLIRRSIAEFLGTFWLVFGGCGAALISAAFPELGIGFLGVAFAFGLTLLTMCYAIGHISGCHINPAVTCGLVAGKRFPVKDLPAYIVAQVLGAIAAAGVLYVIVTGNPSFDAASSTFASNGYGAHSPGNYSLISCFVAEFVLTFFFLLVVMGATDKRVPSGIAPLGIGFVLTLIHLISIPITNTSVNPARSTGPAIFAGYWWPLQQLWLFWVAPILGAVAGGIVYRLLMEERES